MFQFQNFSFVKTEHAGQLRDVRTQPRNTKLVLLAGGVFSPSSARQVPGLEPPSARLLKAAKAAVHRAESDARLTAATGQNGGGDRKISLTRFFPVGSKPKQRLL